MSPLSAVKSSAYGCFDDSFGISLCFGLLVRSFALFFIFNAICADTPPMFTVFVIGM